jgi:hypothetical protein
MLINNWQPIQEYINGIVELLKSETPKNTGNLRDSVDSNITPSDSGAQINVTMDYYGQFIDKGVNGIEVSWGAPYSFTNKRPPVSAFASYTSNISEQFAIAASVYKNGIQPRDFIQPVIDSKIEGLNEVIATTVFKNFFNQYDKKEITIQVW